MGFRPVLVDLDLALQVGDFQLEANDTRKHLVRKLLPQGAPLIGIRRFHNGCGAGKSRQLARIAPGQNRNIVAFDGIINDYSRRYTGISPVNRPIMLDKGG